MEGDGDLRAFIIFWWQTQSASDEEGGSTFNGRRYDKHVAHLARVTRHMQAYTQRSHMLHTLEQLHNMCTACTREGTRGERPKKGCVGMRGRGGTAGSELSRVPPLFACTPAVAPVRADTHIRAARLVTWQSDTERALDLCALRESLPSTWRCPWILFCYVGVQAVAVVEARRELKRSPQPARPSFSSTVPKAPAARACCLQSTLRKR